MPKDKNMPRPLMTSIASLAAMLAASLAVFPSAVLAQANIPTVSAVPGKNVCANSSGQIANAPAKVQICLQKSTNFSHDTYTFTINGKTVNQGIEDESTRGIPGTYKDMRTSLTCVPKLKAPEKVSDIMVRTYQRTMKISEDEARKLVIQQESTEVARQCTARVNDVVVLEVLFKLQ